MRPFYLKQQPTNSKSNLNDNGDPNKILTELRNFYFYEKIHHSNVEFLRPRFIFSPTLE